MNLMLLICLQVATEKTRGRLEQSAHLYALLSSRKLAYEKLNKALFETNQTGASKILLEGFTKAGIRTSLTQCGIHVEHDDFKNTCILAYGRRVKLETFFPNVDTTTLHKLFFETLPEHVYYENIVQKKEFELFHDTIPPEPSFYIPRFISNRIQISKDLFQSNCTDIFVFKGIQRYELTHLVKPNSTASSKDQLECITSRFIYLDRDEDWETIRDKATDPVHLITYERSIQSHVSERYASLFKTTSTPFLDEEDTIFSDEEDTSSSDGEDTQSSDKDDTLSLDEENTLSTDGEGEVALVDGAEIFDLTGKNNNLKCNSSKEMFILENTSGNSEVLSKFRSGQDKCYQKEEEFVKRQLATNQKSNIVCICDTPGMGKTMLLGNIARHFVQHNGIVAFIGLQTFLVRVSRPLPNFDKQPSKALSCLLKCIASTNEHIFLLTTLMEKRLVRMYLLFDGFDEITSLEFEWMKKVFNLIQTFNVIDIYVTSRPHMRQELESSLKVVAYDILPFNLGNQVEFLVNYWLKESPDCNHSFLKSYALRVLKSIKETTSDKEESVAGIPLLCRLIASVYASEAKYCSSPNQLREIKGCSPRTICEMYKEFIEMKINSTIEVLSTSKNEEGYDSIINGKNLKLFHVWQAWKLLFPEVDCFEYLEDVESISIDDLVIYKVGILQRRASGNTTKMEFVHRNLAEFLIAEYLADYILSKKIVNPKYSVLFESILEEVLETKPYRREFSYTVIVYFLNALLTKGTELGSVVTGNQIALFCQSLSATSLQNLLSLFYNWSIQDLCCAKSPPKILASRVLQNLKNNLSVKERVIASIALLYGFIASVFAKRVRIHSFSDQIRKTRCPSYSFCQMCKDFIKSKISRTSGVFDHDTFIGEKSLIIFHVMQAWKLLYPCLPFCGFENLEDADKANFEYKLRGMERFKANIFGGNRQKFHSIYRKTDNIITPKHRRRVSLQICRFRTGSKAFIESASSYLVGVRKQRKITKVGSHTISSKKRAKGKLFKSWNLLSAFKSSKNLKYCNQI